MPDSRSTPLPRNPSPQRPAQPLRSPPCTAPDQQLAVRTAFTICLSNSHRVPVWTAYQLTPEMLEAPSAPRQHSQRFPPQPRCPALDPASSPDALIILTGTLFDCDNIQHIGPGQIRLCRHPPQPSRRYRNSSTPTPLRSPRRLAGNAPLPWPTNCTLRIVDASGYF
ncbi:MAG: DNA/RNA non-specific endonuclease [Acidobacteria bacterium]|nr:DNA/RNA non-specific endonuclease [Acidobacteriota bacterium]